MAIKRVPVLDKFEWQKSVKDKDLSAPPTSPSVGDRYIVASSATGDWSGHDDEIAQWNGSSWDFTEPLEGMFVFVEDEDELYYYITSWQIFSGVGGSDGQIQYNNEGSFSGAADFYYDDENDRIGIGTSSPSEKLHISGGVAIYDSDRTIDDLHHLVDKQYVDEAVTSLGARYYMLNTDSGISDYKLCSLTPSSGSEQSVSVSDLTDDQYIAGWISPNTDDPDKLITGVFNWRIYAAKTSGTKTLRLYWKLVERKSDNSEIVIGTSVISNEIVTGKNMYIIPLTLSSDHDIASDSYVVGKLYADVSGSGSAPSVTLYFEGDSDSHWQIPVNLEIFDNRYVSLTGNQTISGTKTFSSFPVTPSSDPSSDYEVANKQYVDNRTISTIGLSLDGGGEVITTGIKGFIRVPFDCTITKWTLLADQTGSIKIDIWKDTYTSYPPTDADSITNGNEPEISSSDKAEGTDLTGWTTTSINEGDVLVFNVDSCSSITRATLILIVTKN